MCSRRMVLRCGQATATVPLCEEGAGHAQGYRHPTCAERCRIEAPKGSGFSRGEIARHPGRDRSTIHREIGRNGGGRGYRHQRAQGMAEARRKAASSVPWRFTPELWAEVEAKLREGWSPERIGDRFRLEGRPVGRQPIYERVRADRKAGGDLDLPLFCGPLASRDCSPFVPAPRSEVRRPAPARPSSE